MLLVGVVLASTVAGCTATATTNATAGATTAPASAAGSATPSGPTAAVQVKNFAFEPQKLTVKVGTTVTWTFEDSAQHTATAVDKSFNSPKLDNGQKFSWTFTKAGTFDYFCTIHQFMTGTVTVTA